MWMCRYEVFSCQIWFCVGNILALLCPSHSSCSTAASLSPPECFQGEISMLELISKPRTKSWKWQATGCLSGEILLPLPQQPNQPSVAPSPSMGHPYKPTVSPVSAIRFSLNSVIHVYRMDEGCNSSHKMGLRTCPSSWIVFPLSSHFLVLEKLPNKAKLLFLLVLHN